MFHETLLSYFGLYVHRVCSWQNEILYQASTVSCLTGSGTIPWMKFGAYSCRSVFMLCGPSCVKCFSMLLYASHVSDPVNFHFTFLCGPSTLTLCATLTLMCMLTKTNTHCCRLETMSKLWIGSKNTYLQHVIDSNLPSACDWPQIGLCQAPVLCPNLYITKLQSIDDRL